VGRQFQPGQLRPNLLYDISSSYALTASYVAGISDIILNQIVQGTITASVQTGTSAAFLITSASLDLFQVYPSGVAVFATQSLELTNPAPIGGIYFTSSSFFVGLD
jgi:hypothetical protein